MSLICLPAKKYEPAENMLHTIVTINTSLEKPFVRSIMKKTRSVETSNKIRSLISERMKKKFVKKIFRKDEQRYEQAIDTLNSFSTWSEAAREIGNIFIANEIDPYSSVAVKFTEVVHSRFRK